MVASAYIPTMIAPALLTLAFALSFQDSNDLEAAVRHRIARESGAVVSVVVLDPVTGLRLEIQPDLRFHAASTMKVGVLIELGRRIDAGELHWSDSLAVRNRFASIVDGSPYSLDRGSDSDSTVYQAIGTRWTLQQLATRMIVRSSNLATNLLVERLDPGRITATIRGLGADSMVVLRGVEDSKAFQRGLNNTTTARDLGTVLLALASGGALSRETSAALLGILEAQEFNDGIPAGLPKGTRVAHKTGEITATWHDAALVYPPDGAPYAIVVLTRGIPAHERGLALQADVARLVHAAVGEKRCEVRGVGEVRGVRCGV